MNYSVFIEKEANQFINSCNDKLKDTLFKKCLLLKSEPRPRKVKKIVGMHNLYRIRSGNYRLIYFVDDSRKEVKITHIRKRDNNTYKRL